MQLSVYQCSLSPEKFSLWKTDPIHKTELWTLKHACVNGDSTHFVRKIEAFVVAAYSIAL